MKQNARKEHLLKQIDKGIKYSRLGEKMYKHQKNGITKELSRYYQGAINKMVEDGILKVENNIFLLNN